MLNSIQHLKDETLKRREKDGTLKQVQGDVKVVLFMVT